MKQSLLAICVFAASCQSKMTSEQQMPPDSLHFVVQNNETDTIKQVWVDKANGRRYPLPDSIGGKPVAFYLDNPKVAAIPKAFYKGQFRPSDNDSTTQLLSYATTKDSAIRPFYRWCLDFTIRISDGALGEYPGMPAIQYATRYPEEFFDYMDKDGSGQRYTKWTDIIAYSGLEDYDAKPDDIQKQISAHMLENCRHGNDSLKKRIYRFAKDVADASRLTK